MHELLWMYDKVSLLGLKKQEAVEGTAAQQYKSYPASQLSLSFLPIFLNVPSPLAASDRAGEWSSS